MTGEQLYKLEDEMKNKSVMQLTELFKHYDRELANTVVYSIDKKDKLSEDGMNEIKKLISNYTETKKRIALRIVETLIGE